MSRARIHHVLTAAAASVSRGVRVASLIGPAIVITGCGTQRAMTIGATSCGPAYVLELHGRRIDSDNCAGVIPTHHPFRFSIAAGARFTITVGHEATGRLDFPIPAPHGTGIRRLARHGAAVAYQARAAGTTQLVAHHTRFCNDTDRVSSCLVAVITVTPA
jgi:hypothetical protein